MSNTTVHIRSFSDLAEVLLRALARCDPPYVSSEELAAAPKAPRKRAAKRVAKRTT